MRTASLMLGVVFFSAAFANGQKVESEGKAWLTQHTQLAEINVNGVWQSGDWGKVTLAQAEGSREVSGEGDGWDITGVVSGKAVVLLFSSKGKISYSAELLAEGEKTLKGTYSKSLMKPNSKKKPMLLVKQG